MYQIIGSAALATGGRYALREAIKSIVGDVTVGTAAGFLHNFVEGDQEMARLPSRRPTGSPARARGEADNDNGSKPRSDQEPRRGGARRVGEAATATAATAWGVDSILNFAQENFPDAYKATMEFFGRQDVDPESEEFQATGEQGRLAVLGELARNGVAANFGEMVGLSKAEALEFARLARKSFAENVAEHDDEQVERESTGDPVLDEAVVNLQIADACERLGLTGRNRARNLYSIAMIFNSIVEKDVERFERHEQLYGPIRGVRL